MTDGIYASESIFKNARITIAPSWHCDARCIHCFLPENLRSRDRFQSHVVDAILQGLPPHVRVVSFTGGEPFLHLNRFLRLLRKVSDTGRMSTVITNGLWSLDWKRAKKTLAGAVDLGLRGFSVSLDDYHRPSLPRKKLIRLLRYALSLEMVVGIQGVGGRSRQVIARVMKNGNIRTGDCIEGAVNLERVGVAEALSRSDIPSKALSSCMNAVDPLVTPDGNYYSCCSARLFQIKNPVLHKGSVTQTPVGELMERASRDYLLAAVAVWGPAGLLRLLGKKPRTGCTRCEECLRILENEDMRRELNRCIGGDRELRKDIIGRHMILEKCYLIDLYSELRNLSKEAK